MIRPLRRSFAAKLIVGGCLLALLVVGGVLLFFVGALPAFGVARNSTCSTVLHSRSTRWIA